MEPWVQQLLQLVLAWAAIAVVGAMVAVAVFLACRYVLLWFFRVNEAVVQLRDAAESLRAIHALLRSEAEGRERAPAVPVQPGPALSEQGSEAEGRALARLPRAA